MQEVSNRGVKISYEVDGQGPPLMLLHGWACDRSWWAESGYPEDLQQDYRVVNVDLRGHGKSDKPHEPSAYRGEVVKSDVLAVAEAEGIDRFAIWGLSYGGWVGWQTAYAFPERVAALITTGSWEAMPETYEEWLPFDEWLEPMRDGGMAALVEMVEHDEPKGQFPAWERAMLLRADPEALLACLAIERHTEGIPTFEGFPVPALLIAGELEDPDGEAVRVAGLLPNGESLVLPGLGHSGACAASALALPTARAFLSRWHS